MYVADYDQGQIFRFNASSGAYEGQFGLGFLSEPYGLTVDSNNVVYVANAGGDNVVRFNGLTRKYSFAAGFAQLPVGVQIGPYNELFVSDYISSKVFRFDSQAGTYEGYVGGGIAAAPVGVGMDPNGVFDVFDEANLQIVKLNSQTGLYMGDMAQGYAGFGYGMAINQNAVVYLSDFYNGVIDLFNNETGGYIGKYGAGTLLNPTFVAVTPQPVTVLPLSYSLFRGSLVSGNLASLYYADANYLSVTVGPTSSPSQPPVQVILTGTSPTTAPVTLSFTVVSKMNTPGTSQTIWLYNYATSAYVAYDTRAVGTGTTTVTVTATGTLSNYVNAAGTVQAKVSYIQTGPTSTSHWIARLDQTNWEILTGF